ncbi:MAG TPA: c-type cytochrome [Vicinamibacterales bacterium]|nr:c-type cytochrome [Vicinamibacterales bacterium]
MQQTRHVWLAIASTLLIPACSGQPAPNPQPEKTVAAAPAMSPVERGKYIVTAGGCNDCHTPWKMGPNGPEPDMTRMLSGHPEGVKVDKPPKLEGMWMAAVSNDFTTWSGPWGISYTANLTPDQNTGLGIWTEDMFIKAIREGKHMGTSRPILPPMPWPAFRNYNDDDLKAIFAYLKTIPAIHNQVPDPIIADPPKAPAK